MLTILVALIIAGLILWAIEQFPLDATIKSIIRVVVIVTVCLWLISLVAPVGMIPLRLR
jgi:hypothetical protein